MGLCGSTEAINPDFVDLSHFELLKVVGKGGFGKGERQLDGAGAKDQQRARTGTVQCGGLDRRVSPSCGCSIDAPSRCTIQCHPSRICAC